MKVHKLAAFIFRRDHRLDDNTALLQALKISERVIPCFIFDSAQIDPQKNSYFSSNCVQFMIESLQDLNRQLEQKNSRLFFFHGELETTVRHIVETVKPDALFVNEDVTPYSIKRDKKISDICASNSIKFYSYEDIMILPKQQVLTQDGRYFRVYSPFFKEASKYPVREPVRNNFNNYLPANERIEGEYPPEDIKKFYVENPHLEVRGGRQNALKILQNIKAFKNYTKTRDYPSIPTTKLSAYNKFGCVSIREVYATVNEAFGAECHLMKELFWREFYYYLAYHEPKMLDVSMRPEYTNIAFNNNLEWYERWKEGKTGCPIVDAGMRHLNTTGYLSNRLRMLVANYLTKDLLIDWKLGEKYFAQKLVDYDLCQNNGGWQWSASTGTDYNPELRIFNPALQSKKFDNDCKYILTWVPELKDVERAHIHDWEECHGLYKGKVNYPEPLVKHFIQKEKCLKMYEKAGLLPEDQKDVQRSKPKKVHVDYEEKKSNERVEPPNYIKKIAKNETFEPTYVPKNTQKKPERPQGQNLQQEMIGWFQKNTKNR